jgi:hypothetical protein
MSTEHTDVDLEVEPELGIEPEPELEVEPEQPTSGAALVSTAQPLMDVLPADFPLPALIRFVPDVRLKAAANAATAYLLSLDVTGPDGLQRADLALSAERDTRKAIEAHFADPADIANKLHKRLTGLRGEWCEPGESANKLVGRRVWAEKQRLDALAAEERRKEQEKADADAREKARREADAAAKAKAPEPVIQQLREQAETATAAPVPVSTFAAPKLARSTTVTTWKCRLVGTPADADPNPEMEKLTPAQKARVLKLMAAVTDGRAPINCFAIDWSYMNGRVRKEEATLDIPEIEPFADGGVRAKGRR